MDNLTEVFLVKSLVIRPQYKSIRKFRMCWKRLPSLRIDFPQPRTGEMMLLPETSIVGTTSRGKPIYLNRFSTNELGDNLDHPLIAAVIDFSVHTEREADMIYQIVTRKVTLAEWGDHFTTMRYEFDLPEDTSPLLSTNYRVERLTGNFLKFHSSKSREVVLFVRVGSEMIPTESRKFTDIFYAGLHFRIHGFGVDDADSIGQKLYLGLSKFIASWIQLVYSELDAFTKWLYGMKRSLHPATQAELETLLLTSRSDAIEILVDFVRGPLQILLQSSNTPCQLSRWLESLEHTLVKQKSQVELHKKTSLDLERLFDWEFCTFHESSLATWKAFFELASQDSRKRFLHETKLFISSHSPRKIKILEASESELLNMGWQLQQRVDYWNQSFPLPLEGMKTKPVWSTIESSFTQNPDNHIYSSLMSHLASRSCHANSFVLPRKSKSQKGALMMRNNLVFMSHQESSGWTFELLAFQEPTHPRFSTRFQLNPDGVWVFKNGLDWPAAIEIESIPPETWDCYSADFTLYEMFVLFGTQSQTYLTRFDPFGADLTQTSEHFPIRSPVVDVTDLDFSKRIEWFYQNLHEPHRSEAFKWTKSHRCLLWAVLMISDSKILKRNVCVNLVLTAFSNLKEQVLPQIQQTFECENEWIWVQSELGDKRQLDPRHNQTLSFYFSWREISSRVIGVWLKSFGGYAIYVKTNSRFIMCAKRTRSSFTDYFMVELVPATPGYVGSSPMLFKRNHTIKHTLKNVSLGLAELQLKII